MRTRLLHPGFFTNEELAGLPLRARLLYAGLWLLADRAGRLEDRPARIKAAVFPYERVRVDALLSTLEKAAFVKRYTVRGTRCLALPRFAKFQHPHHREPESRLPPEPGLDRAEAGPGRVDPVPRSGTDQDQDRTAPRKLPFRIYAAIAMNALEEAPSEDLGALAERFKTTCARQGLPYNATVTTKALSAATTARARRQR